MAEIPNHQKQDKEQKHQQEKQKMLYFTYIALAITLIAVLLIVTTGLKPIYLSLFLITVIWLVMIFFYFFEKFLDWLKEYLDNRPSKPK